MRSAVVALFLAETVGLVVLAPLAGLFTALRVRSRCAGLEPATSASRMLAGAGWLARGVLTPVSLVVAASIVIALAIGAFVDTAALWWFHAVLLAAAMALAMVGAVCASTFREPLDAAACAIAISTTVAAGVFVAGPALDNIPGQLLEPALLVNPVVATAVAGNIDIFRMHPLYQLSPLAHRQVDYASASTAFATHAAIAVILLLVTARRSSIRAIAISVERTSP